jgi:serine acetyltransferase
MGRGPTGSGEGSAAPLGGGGCTGPLYRGPPFLSFAPATYHFGVSRARSLPAPIRRGISRLVHGAWDLAGQLGAVGPDDPQGQRFGRMGKGACLLFPQGAIYNEHLIHIGAQTMVGPNTCITAGMAPGQEMPTNPVVSIGQRCIIGRGSHIVGHWSIEIGDDIQTGPYVYITDQNHTYEDPVEPIGRQWPTEAAVRIGSGSWLGANVVILPGAQIGEHVVVAAGAVVRGVVPDRCVVAGVPARIVRRWVEGQGWLDEKDVALP